MKSSKFALSTALVVLLSVSVWASDKMKTKIQIDQPVNVGSTQLAPGEYEMTWIENGSEAEVTFWQWKKVIATVPALITHVRSGYENPALHTDSSSHTLTAVELPKVLLSLTSNNATQAKSGK